MQSIIRSANISNDHVKRRTCSDTLLRKGWRQYWRGELPSRMPALDSEVERLLRLCKELRKRRHVMVIDLINITPRISSAPMRYAWTVRNRLSMSGLPQPRCSALSQSDRILGEVHTMHMVSCVPRSIEESSNLNIGIGIVCQGLEYLRKVFMVVLMLHRIGFQ